MAKEKFVRDKPHINVVTPYKKITMATVLINKLDEFNLNIDLG